VSGSLGTPRLHLRRTDSTNSRARVLAAGGAPHGTLVTAAEQTAGRGRQGRAWSAPPGRALLCSLVLRELDPLLPLQAALAVADLARWAALDARIKWPNDVLVDGRKLAGILVEGRPQEGWAVLGIGVNVAVRAEDLPEELRGSAATLGREPGDVEPALAELLAALRRRAAEPASRTLTDYRALDALCGREIHWSGGEGLAEGIADDGNLLVRTAGGVVAVGAGEVHIGSA
jgi:BirA family biotin operon repressor/biotin-[acetyl-CoA-carboxylase] ligase